jgi:hypothetical protein
MSPVCSVGPVGLSRSVHPTSLLTIFPLPLLIFSSFYHSIPPALATDIPLRGYIRLAVVFQSRLLVLLIIPVTARDVENLGPRAFDDLSLRVAADDPMDFVPCAHLGVGADCYRAACSWVVGW